MLDWFKEKDDQNDMTIMKIYSMISDFRDKNRNGSVLMTNGNVLSKMCEDKRNVFLLIL